MPESSKTMTHKFDVFRVETDGCVRWLAAVATLREATELARQLAPQAPNGMIVLDQKTGTRYTVDPSRSPNAATHSEANNDCAQA